MALECCFFKFTDVYYNSIYLVLLKLLKISKRNDYQNHSTSILVLKYAQNLTHSN